MSSPGSIRVTSLKQAVPSLLAMAVFVFGLYTAASALGITEIFGVSIGWRWSMVDTGSVHHRTLTPQIAGVGATTFLVPGEELEAEIDFAIESGRARVAIYDDGWFGFEWSGFDEHVTLFREVRIRTPFRRTVRVTATRPGLHTIDGDIFEATGTFDMSWRVHEARTAGRAVRSLRFLLFSLPGAIVLILLLAAGAIMLFRRG